MPFARRRAALRYRRSEAASVWDDRPAEAAPVTTRLVGEPVERLEDGRLLRGLGTYTDDLGHDAAHAAFVRSEHAHARIVDIDRSEAAAIDGVLAIFTHRDLEDAVGGPFPVLIPHPGFVEPRTQRALAKDEVCYVGEAIAMVVAVDRYVAEDAASRVEVRYEPLPAAVDLAAAAAGAPVAHQGMADNVAGRFAEERGAVEAALASAPHVFAWRIEVERSAGMPLEGRAVYARYDPGDDRLLVYDSTQAPTGIRAGLATLLGMPSDRVDVVAPDIGGGFGTKIMQFYAEELLVPWAARRLGAAVKWVEDRRESFIASNHERKQIHDVRVGCDQEGRVLAFETSFVHDTGAYCPYGLIVPTITAAQLPGPYKLENYAYRFESIYTNTVPTSPYRGAGRPHGVFVIERVLDRIAVELGLDRADVRRRNFISPDEFPYDVGVTFQDGGPTIYDSGDYPRGFELLMDAIDYAGFRASRTQAQAQGRRLGIGFACYVEGTGIGPYEGAVVKVNGDGTISVATGLSTQGQGHETIFAQIAADELGVGARDVQVTTGDTRRIEYGVGTFASRTAVVAGNAIRKAAAEVHRQAVELAADLLEAAPQDIELRDGHVRVRGVPGSAVPIGQLAVIANPLRYAFGEQAQQAAELAQRASASGDRPLPEGRTPGLAATEYFSPSSGVYGFGMHAAVVEVDPVTHAVAIRRYVVMHDCGRIVNPVIVEGQIVGGLAQGIGGALYEAIVYDDTGQPRNASFMDFLMPYSTETVPAAIVHTETPSPNNPLGVKGVGEAGVIPVAAAIANAISDALGRPVDRAPVNPSDLFDLVQAAAA
jgi:aerobic carbon-monoxide dehydrogenase large subunit